jgi:hypothetical protein
MECGTRSRVPLGFKQTKVHLGKAFTYSITLVCGKVSKLYETVEPYTMRVPNIDCYFFYIESFCLLSLNYTCYSQLSRLSQLSQSRHFLNLPKHSLRPNNIMFKTAFLFAGLALSINAQVSAPANSLDLGQTCSDDTQCKNGANCYGTTKDTIRACGNFNAACDDDSQCAFNTCSNGLCSGFLALTSTSASSNTASTTTAASPSIITGTAGSQPSGQAPITAAEGSLGLGETCSDDRQCANGASCYGTTAFTIRSCGNFNAQCENDSQCAFNTCNNGLCNGFLATQAAANGTMTTAVIAPTGGLVSTGNGSAVATATGGMKPSSSGVPFEGSASSMSVAGGVVAVLAGVVAFMI